MVRRTVLALVAAAILLANGCGASPPAAPVPPSPIANCITAQQQQSGSVTLHRTDGRTSQGVVLGKGDTGVVLANMSDNNPCDWIDFATVLTGKGLRTLLFNYTDRPEDNRLDLDVLAGLQALRDQGIRKVFLIGASMGGTFALAAAAAARPPVAGVIDLSGPITYGGVDAMPAARTLTVPALFVAETEDFGYAQDTRDLHAAYLGPDKQLKILPGPQHGTAMLPDVGPLVEAFLTSH
jgi:Dienelactone hydrolase family